MSYRTWRRVEQGGIAAGLVVSLLSVAGVIFVAGAKKQQVDSNSHAIVEVKADVVAVEKGVTHRLDRIEDSVNEVRTFLMGDK